MADRVSPGVGAPDPALATVQRAALERALLEGGDVDRSSHHLALAGALDVVRPERAVEEAPTTVEEIPTTVKETHAAGETDLDGDDVSAGVLPSALLCLLAVSALDSLDDSDRRDLGRSTSPVSTPWHPSSDAHDRCLRRGARLALAWFDVSPERVAGAAGLPKAELESMVDDQ